MENENLSNTLQTTQESPSLKKKRKQFLDNLVGDLFGGTAAMLVALPSAIAFGLIIYAPLGPSLSGKAALVGMIGTVVLGLVTPLAGGTKRLVTAPCAPAAAVLSVFVMELMAKGNLAAEIIPIYITIVAILAGAFQVIVGYLGGGRFIKYIPYPVVAGYLSGVGVLIFAGQLPKFFGLPPEIGFWESFISFDLWKWQSIVIAIITIIVMVYSSKIIKILPASILALLSGVITYFVIGIFYPEFLTLQNNNMVIGEISASISDLTNLVTSHLSLFGDVEIASLAGIIVPVITLGVLLSIDTLKTCVVLDALTFTRHNSNREIVGQGIGNVAAGLACGIPGAGTMGPTLVNFSSGAKTQFSGFIVGITSVIVLLLLGSYVAWIPIASLAGILIVVGIRMIDKKTFELLKSKTTIFDFFVTFAVVLAAVSYSLIIAAGVGIGLAILLFLREQMRTSVVRRKVFGNQIFSKKVRLEEELDVLIKHGDQTLVIELQGQLFFGTTDQLLSELDPLIGEFKYIILDMKRVLSLDYTAAHLLKQIKKRIKKQKGFLIFSSVPLSLPTGQNVRKYLNELGLNEKKRLKFFDSLDLALEWAEDHTLKDEGTLHHDESKPLELHEIEVFEDMTQENVNIFKNVMIEKELKKGEHIFQQGDESEEMYFIRKGNVKIVLQLKNDMIHHIATFPRGGYFGDMSFLDREKRSADAFADGDVSLYVLERKKFDEIVNSHPGLGTVFFEQLALTISNRLRQSNIELKALEEN
ncbi:MAG: cyclic nucleotide-binding domain-containing protein [Melioribacteraceae bacterium]|nr:cyclic nucleotide-binding domain-containing protein [Melioribacteraceae bacterium]MCF8356512.1 cyclic nucleotide-binding domain-containing protein [Melioribacteraceae bacterium]MCF8396122.1 cyclic nucleotide-binding domain-containing protein [Melioribacteraceae bacterium]MCF8420955.1 cyclic nucleotide-binding domain-containing protein [Melioribacteraceae bacterium]